MVPIRGLMVSMTGIFSPQDRKNRERKSGNRPLRRGVFGGRKDMEGF
jgi:hypothetical protein